MIHDPVVLNDRKNGNRRTGNIRTKYTPMPNGRRSKFSQIPGSLKALKTAMAFGQPGASDGSGL